jgi:hypothetical protein
VSCKRLLAAVSRDHIALPAIRGEHYRPSCGQCLPWELCACSFDWAKQGQAMPSSVEIQEPTTANLFNQTADERLKMLLECA